jgi:hypothetical protein
MSDANWFVDVKNLKLIYLEIIVINTRPEYINTMLFPKLKF